jgi:hypothetical protein
MVAAYQSGQHQGRMNESCRKMSEPGANAKPPTREGKWGYGTGLENRRACKGTVASNPTPSVNMFSRVRHRETKVTDEYF